MDDLEIGLCWGTIHRASLVDMIELAGRHGFPTISVPPHIYFASLEAGETPASLRDRLSRAGTRVTVIDCISAGMPGMPAGATEFDGQTIPQFDARTCLKVAEELEAPIVNISLYHSQPVPIDEMAGAVGDICRMAAPAGRRIVIEFYPESGIASLQQAHAIARECGEPNCGVLLDTWHFARSGGTIAEIEELPPHAIGAMQISDRIEPPPGTAYVPMTGRKLPGEGELPLNRIVAAACANSPGITAEIEVFSQELSSMSLNDAAARTADAVHEWRHSAAR